MRPAQGDICTKTPPITAIATAATMLTIDYRMVARIQPIA
jgi:hypothetical protein